ncbi:MAG: MATE family efflux transporter [Treponema sp.]|nr:MATE family efflux transporter [Candidatus Treponema equifaecale]
MLQKFTHPDLLKGGIFKSLLFFTLPLLISYLFQQLYNSVDTIIIGHYLGEGSLAAIGASTAIFDLLVGFGIGFGNGLSIVAARAFGAGDEKKLKKTVFASIIITFSVTAAVMLVAGIFLKNILGLLGTPAEILEEAHSYISVISVFCGVLFLFNLFSGMLRAIGNSFTPLLFLVFSSILNIGLDLFFITKLGWGIKGAAVATVIAQGISAVFCLIYILKCASILVPSKNHLKVERFIYRDLVAQGFSMALMGSIVQSGTVILQSAINSFGIYTIAGHICARKIFSLTNIPCITIGVASATFVSQNYGATQFERIKKGVKAGILMSSIWTSFLLLTLPFVLKRLVVFMSGSENSEVLDYAVKYISFMLPFYYCLGGIFVIRNSLQGLGYKILPLVSSVIELLGKIMFTKLIIPILGTWGVILCEPLIWVAMLVQLWFVYWRRSRRFGL